VVGKLRRAELLTQLCLHDPGACTRAVQTEHTHADFVVTSIRQVVELCEVLCWNEVAQSSGSSAFKPSISALVS